MGLTGIKGPIDKGPFVVFDIKTAATNLQRFAVQWLIATYRLSYAKSIQISVLKEMLIAIIDEHNLLGEGQSCAVLSKQYALAFTDLTKKVKAAAGIFCVLLCCTRWCNELIKIVLDFRPSQS